MILKIGDQGEAVKALQEALIKLGDPIDADGVFGVITHDAVERFQYEQGLTMDGIAGPLTLAKLGIVPVQAAPSPIVGGTGTGKFIDVSGYEKNVSYPEVKAAGYIGVGIKATEGVTFLDAFQSYHVQGAMAAGLPFFVYHFLRFKYDGQEQAHFFLAHAKGKRFCVDFEPADGKTEADAEAMQILRDCCDEIEAQTGQKPIIYFSTGFVMNLPAADLEYLNQHRCWVAAYASHVHPPKQITNIMGWQFQFDPKQTSHREEIPGAGWIDCSYYYGEDLAKECVA